MLHNLTFVVLLIVHVVPSAPLTAAKVQRMIKVLGPNQAAKYIFESSEDSGRFLQGVASGSAMWLRAAVRLAPGLDGHPAEAVQSAVGAALRHRPDLVLLLGPPTFTIGEICDAPDIDEYEHLAPALAELRARQTAVRMLASKNLVQRRDECLTLLAAAEKPLRSFFAKP